MFSLLNQDIQNVIVFDLEWNQSGYNPNHRMPHEIIEIGACRVDREGHVVSRFSELIRPRVYKRLDKHIKQVTASPSRSSRRDARFRMSSAILFRGAARMRSW